MPTVFSVSQILYQQIIPIAQRVRVGNAQPEDQPGQDSIWASNQHITIYCQRLARQVLVRFSTDPAEGTLPIRAIARPFFLGKLIIDVSRASIDS